MNLYEKGKTQQWNTNTRIDWSQDLDPENPQELPDESVTIRNIRIGTTDAERSEVVSGISPHELIVIDGVDSLQAGSRVAVSWSQDEDTRKNDRNGARVATSGRSGNGGGKKP